VSRTPRRVSNTPVAALQYLRLPMVNAQIEQRLN